MSDGRYERKKFVSAFYDFKGIDLYRLDVSTIENMKLLISKFGNAIMYSLVEYARMTGTGY